MDCTSSSFLTGRFVEEVAGALPSKPTDIARDLGEKIERVVAALQRLEGEGRVVTGPGGTYLRAAWR